MLSFRGFVILVFLLIRLLYDVIRYAFLGGPYRKYKNNFRRTMMIHLVRGGSRLSMEDLDSISPATTEEVFKMVAKKHKPITDKLNNYSKKYDEKAYWLVEKPHRNKGDPVAIYLHGGGYYVQTSVSQIESVISIYQLVEKEKNLSILVLGYSLVTHGSPMPTQLNELHKTYTSLSQECNNVLLWGDSAGGNLAITYLQKLKMQFNTTTPFPTKLLLISPWVKLLPDPYQYTRGHSYYENRNRDIIKYIDRQTVYSIIGSQPLQSLTVSPNNVQPLSTSHWDGIPTLRNGDSDVFLLLGEDESFRDDILQWAEVALQVPLAAHNFPDSHNVYDETKMAYHRPRGKNSPSVRVYIEPWGIHDAWVCFEHELINTFNIQHSSPRLADISGDHYFGSTQIVRFLNDTL